LSDVLAALRMGVPLEQLFPPLQAEDSCTEVEPTLGTVMDDFLADRRGSVTTGTVEADEWAIGHLRLFWGHRRPSEATPQLVDQFRRQKVAEAVALQKRIEDGERPLEDRCYVRKSDGVRVQWKQPRRPLSARSINRLIAMLATLLDVAMERSDVEFTANAARGLRRKLKVQQPKFRTFLEVDQVWGLLDAAVIRQDHARGYHSYAYPARAILPLLTLGGLRIAEATGMERGLVNLSVGVMHTARSKTAAGYREVDIIFEMLHDDLAQHLGDATPFGGPTDLLIPSGTGNPITSSNVRQRVLDKTVLLANELLRERGVPEIRKCTPHTLRRTYINLLLAAGCDPAYVQQQVGHTDPTLTLRIYQQLLKRKRREEYRERVNELLGTSPAAVTRLPKNAESGALGPDSGPNAFRTAA
jgi:integrase